MYKVMIVDDEPWVAYGIKTMIDWGALGFTVIGEANNGLAALEKIAEIKPEVVISDIRMPGLNGIDLLGRIKEAQLTTRVILVSGFAEFEYAQKALRLGAFDYLLKKIDKNKLTETMLRLKSVLSEERKSHRADMTLSLDDLFELLEPDNKIKVGNFLSNKGMSCDYPHFRFVSCLYPDSSAPLAEEELRIMDGLQHIRFRTGQNKISYLIHYDESKDPVAFLDFVEALLGECECIGIGGIGVFSAPIAKLYQESDIALSSMFCQPEQRIIKYKEAIDAAELMKRIPPIEWAMKEHKKEQIAKGLDELCAECKSRQIQVDQLSTLYNQIVSLVYKYHPRGEAPVEIEYLNYAQIVRLYSSIEQMFETIKAIFDHRDGEDQLIGKEMVRKIIDRIDNGFTEDISLGDLSRKFNISIGYLSALIKKETGTTYTEYVTGKRLNLAKELLADTSLSVYEITERVGYRDYFHFNKMFKKHFGMTPSQYRKA